MGLTDINVGRAARVALGQEDRDAGWDRQPDS
jgi:hypothetical protein